MAKRNGINWVALIAAILISQLAGVIGSIATFPSIPTWYATLTKPSFNPPNWVFGPVWLTLFTLMGISAYFVWEKGLKHRWVREGLFVFGVQLVLNILWSVLFFGLHYPLYSLIEIILLWLSIALTIFMFCKVSKKAALLLLPYIAWVSFAAILNFYIWQLNP